MMERLTKKDGKGGRMGISIREAMDRLAAYEDSGLTPEEVMELAKTKNNEEVSKMVHAMWRSTPSSFGGPFCTNCGHEADWIVGRGFYKTRYCPFCGAKMDLHLQEEQ